MIQAKNFNNIPDAMLPVLKRGEVAIYVNTGNSTTADGKPMFNTQFVPNTDSVMVSDGDWRQIAYVTRAVPEKSKKIPLGRIVFDPAGKGIITLSGDRAQDVHLFHYLELCNYNESNTDRDKSKRTYFKRLVAGAESQKLLDAEMKKAEATMWAMKTPLKELVEALATRGTEVKGLPEATIRSLALAEATKNPFTETVKTTEGFDAFAKAVAEAMDADQIKFSVHTQTLANTETDNVYPVPGLLQTTPKKQKLKMLIDACQHDEALYQLVMGDVETFLK